RTLPSMVERLARASSHRFAGSWWSCIDETPQSKTPLRASRMTAFARRMHIDRMHREIPACGANHAELRVLDKTHGCAREHLAHRTLVEKTLDESAAHQKLLHL